MMQLSILPNHLDQRQMVDAEIQRRFRTMTQTLSRGAPRSVRTRMYEVWRGRVNPLRQYIELADPCLSAGADLGDVLGPLDAVRLYLTTKRADWLTLDRAHREETAANGNADLAMLDFLDHPCAITLSLLETAMARQEAASLQSVIAARREVGR